MPFFWHGVMKNSLLSVLSDALAFLKANLSTVLIVAGAVVVVVALIVIIVCSARIRKERARRRALRESEGLADIAKAEQELPDVPIVAESEKQVASSAEDPAEPATQPAESVAMAVSAETNEQSAEPATQPVETAAMSSETDGQPIESAIVAGQSAAQSEVSEVTEQEQQSAVKDAQPAEEAVSVKAETVEEQSVQTAETAAQSAEPEKAEDVSAEEQKPEITMPESEKAEKSQQSQTVIAAEQPSEQNNESAPAQNAASRLSEEQRAELERQADQGHVTFIKPHPGMFIRYRYNRSFSAKLIQSEEKVKRYYSELKNALLAYKKVVPRVSWRHESFRYGRPSVAKFVIRGKTLCLCLALNPADYAESKYIVDDMSRYAKFANTPLLYRIKNDRRCRYAKELIAKLFDGAEPSDHTEEDFSDIPYEETQPLVERGLIKIVSYEEVALPAEAEGQAPVVEEEFEDDDDFEGEDFDDDDEDELEEVSAADVGSLMADDKAKLRVQQGEELSDKSKSGVINIDTLGQFFEEGERVTLDEIKKRVPFVAKSVTYIKVLARGKLSKPLVVVADDFSLEAVKMIVLTGGRAIRTKKK